ncbi:recombinase family protein [Crenobacter intestini]|uniref:Recombinase family protein n=1 Tax=Crenobacter intestini TaxID=2563443 RepID=A0A4T0V130_9NEIS|nr:recombinase family protein [Crenobacter intestini]TIC85218.1 recombinase family protein [Crenobacter intestini]
MKVGYARVSTTGQDLDTQLAKLEGMGCEKVFQEKVSGKTADNRTQLAAMLDFVREGDCVVACKLDRLARSVLDLNTIAKRLQEKGVDLIVLDQNIDTTTPTGRLLFNMLGSIAEFERDLINERTAEGRKAAVAKGVKMGRKPSLTEKKKEEMLTEAESWEGSKGELAKKYGVTRATLYRALSEKI